MYLWLLWERPVLVVAACPCTDMFLNLRKVVIIWVIPGRPTGMGSHPLTTRMIRKALITLGELSLKSPEPCLFNSDFEAGRGWDKRMARGIARAIKSKIAGVR